MSGSQRHGAVIGLDVHRASAAGTSRAGRGVALVLGAGDIGSAVARTLYLDGWAAVVLDRPCPSWHRRGMSYVDVAYGEPVALDGVWGIPVQGVADTARTVAARAGVAVTVDCDLEALLARVGVDLIVDARMRKRSQPQSLLGHGPLSIGLGPNFVAGEQVHAVVETAWGPGLGRAAWHGGTLAQAGEPRSIGGAGRDRYLYSPRPGRFTSLCAIAQPVAAGQPVAMVEGELCRAPLSGAVRGIAHTGAEVETGTKVFEVDPRGAPGACFGVGERPRKIARGVLEAVAEAMPAWAP